MKDIRNEVEQFARLAGEYAEKNIHRVQESFKNEDVRNIVTNIDIEISNILKKEIKKIFPEHAFYSEEEPGKINNNVYTWVIDPLDGTANYVRRLPQYSSCVAVMKEDEVIEAAVYCPTLNECFSVSSGKSFRNAIEMSTSSTYCIENAYVNFHPGRKPEDVEWAVNTKKELLMKAKKSMNIGSSALDLCYVADGRIDILIYGTLTTLDVAGAIKIVREAGGDVYNYYTKKPVAYSVEPQRIIATANPILLEDYFANTTPK